jgi:hypothetical protein
MFAETEDARLARTTVSYARRAVYFGSPTTGVV